MVTKIVLLLLFIFASMNLHAELEVRNVFITCQKKRSCKDFEKDFAKLIGFYPSYEQIEETIKIFLLREGIEKFSYEIVKYEEKYYLYYHLSPRPTITNLQVVYKPALKLDFSTTALGIQVGDYFDPDVAKKAIQTLKIFLAEHGYLNTNINLRVKIMDKGRASLVYRCDVGKPTILEQLDIIAESNTIRKVIIDRFAQHMRKPFSNQSLRDVITELKTELFSNGYYLVNITSDNEVDDFKGKAIIRVENEQQYAFSFNEKDLIFTRTELLNEIRQFFEKFKKDITPQNIQKIFADMYYKRGYTNIKTDVQSQNYKNKFNENVKLIQVKITENTKAKISEVKFRGNNFYTETQLMTFYEEQEHELSRLKYLDVEYYNIFKETLKKKYITNGFVKIDIQGPNLYEDTKNQKSVVEFQIIEGPRYNIDKIEIIGLKEEERLKAIELMTNKKDQAFNPVGFEEDLLKLTDYVQEQGYYYAAITNLSSDNIVTYNQQLNLVSIRIEMKTGDQLRLRKFILIGNEKTKDDFILAHTYFWKDDIISPSKIKTLQEKISSTGIFTTVIVRPVVNNMFSDKTDILISVVEKNSITMQVAPGFRTDLGMKLSTEVNFANLRGQNENVNFKAQINQRLNFSTLAPERRNEKEFLEYDTQVSYGVPGVAGRDIGYNTSLSVTRKRFFSFDADIRRIGFGMTKEWSQRFYSSLNYQYEEISQYTAVQVDDNGLFRIGSITPSVNYDLRNSRINPTKGAFFGLSCEFATPWLLSRGNDDTTIDFYKLISRNRFYYPIKGGVIAVYIAMGMQKNSADAASIPSIKVFRLTGTDIIRGYDDEEMNLVGLTDASEINVTNAAYMSLYKIEPRFFINDSMMLGVFLDGGRIFVDSWRPLDVRTSTGLSFKYLTPVGSLDFDYGIKLGRRELPGSGQESVGRLHISIGFF
ncbi:MAG: BamA/TamA family outer membrane protein [Bacteriovoracaceae bacterium]|nr:BamA/TamA family outer membrane protein [Bacteriovoracaceae bacterium]